MHRKAILSIACALATAASLLLLSQQVAGNGRASDMRIADFGAPLGLFEDVTDFGECIDYPYVKFQEVIRNNFGNHGPDSGDEGLILKATVNHTGLGLNNAPIYIEIHNTSEYQIEHKDWARDWNGLHGHFASICLKHGTNVSFQVTARLPGRNETLTLPRFGLSAFDLDIGPNNTVEFIELSGFDHFYVTENTLVKVNRDGKGTARFTATIQGNGSDNPEEPELLTVEQKHKSVTVEYSNVQKVPITIGAIGGSSGRVFSFTARPILLCAKTKTANGSVGPGEKETVENHTANSTNLNDHTADGSDLSGARERCDAGLLGLVLSLSLSLITALTSA